MGQQHHGGAWGAEGYSDKTDNALVLTAVLGEYVRAYDARFLEVPGLLARLPHGRSGGDHPVLGLLRTHGYPATIPCPRALRFRGPAAECVTQARP